MKIKELYGTRWSLRKLISFYVSMLDNGTIKEGGSAHSRLKQLYEKRAMYSTKYKK